jgi:hypothetical protein
MLRIILFVLLFDKKRLELGASAIPAKGEKSFSPSVRGMTQIFNYS